MLKGKLFHTKRTLILLILGFSPFFIPAQHSLGDRLVGEYWTENREGKIGIEKLGELYLGKILWREEERKDTENPDPTLRDRSVVGITFLKDFRYNPKEEIWEGGSVYAIDNGGTYSGKMWLEEEGKILKMRGYWGISLLGRTATLERVE